MSLARDQRRRVNYRALMSKLKAAPCADCGRTFPPVCMDFDHTERNKVRGVGSMKNESPAKLLAEIAKCELVCSNCHRIRTEERRRG